jgi:adenine deaminase
MILKGQFVDILEKEIYPAAISIDSGIIEKIEKLESAPSHYILPGFVDAHIHIESSMLTPYEFARKALGHGTVATVSDPHEIANVMGMEGIQYMIDNSKDALLKFHFGAPSCVPATPFENAGAVISIDDVKTLMASNDIYYLSEMMNYPGVLNENPEVMEKLAIAKASGKVIDGHAPGLMGALAQQYIDAGISTDHECFTEAEALNKLKHGMKILIREGSAAKNFEALHPLIKDHWQQLMFCSDDKHPDDLMEGHINQLVERSLKLGYDLFHVLYMACIHPVLHYNLSNGILRIGDPADFIISKDLTAFNDLETYINGQKVANKDSSILKPKTHKIINQFNIGKVKAIDFEKKGDGLNQTVIEAIDGELITQKLIANLPVENGNVQSNPAEDILKIAVINRYREAPIATAFIKNFYIKEGAIASTVAHDSHNIIVVGSSDEYLAKAVNLLVENKGGLSAVNKETEEVIALPIAGLMSDKSCEEIGNAYSGIDTFVKAMGCSLHAPYMTLSFMALLVIPKIKISDLGLFDAEAFEFIENVNLL